MGSVVGEKLTRAIERAAERRLPLIIVSGSGGGARMHEGMLSLMQMAKVSAALARFDQAGGLFISVLTNPTMGGVAASFASLGDVVFAEPKALIGFAGPRTIKATIRIELPKGFQTSEFLLEHGFIDRIVRRKDLQERDRPNHRLLRQVTEIAPTNGYCGKSMAFSPEIVRSPAAAWTCRSGSPCSARRSRERCPSSTWPATSAATRSSG